MEQADRGVKVDRTGMLVRADLAVGQGTHIRSGAPGIAIAAEAAAVAVAGDSGAADAAYHSSRKRAPGTVCASPQRIPCFG